MSTIHDVIRLRKAGQLEEALTIANELNDQYPGHKRLMSQYAWIFFAKLKAAVINKDVGTVHLMLDEILALTLEKKEAQFLGNHLGYKLYSLIKEWPVSQRGGEIKALLQKIINIRLDVEADPVPSILMLRLFLKTKSIWSPDEQIAFLEWVTLEKFPEKEYQPFILDSGKPIMPLAEQAYTAYAKAWGNKLNLSSGSEALANLKVFKIRLLKVMASYPRYKFLPYLYSKILLFEGEGENALTFMVAFVKKNRQEYWAWSGLAAIFESLGQDQNAQIAYAQALSLGSEEGFLLKVRQSFGSLLLKNGKLAEAKYQFQKSIETRLNSGYKIPSNLNEIQHSQWFQETEPVENDSELLADLSKESGNLLYEDLPLAIGVVVRINKEKMGLHILADRDTEGFTRVKNWQEFEQGDFVEVRIEARDGQQGSYFTFPVVRHSNQPPSEDLVFLFSGSLEKRGPDTFGFVNSNDRSVFVPQFLASAHPNKLQVNGIAISSFNKNKGIWGWKAISLKASDTPKQPK